MLLRGPYFDREVRRASDIAVIYDKAHSCKLIINALSLVHSLYNVNESFVHSDGFSIRNSGYKLKLLDDTGTSSMPTVSRSSSTSQTLRFLKGTSLQNEFSYASNGLYFAKSGENTCAIIIPPEISLLAWLLTLFESTVPFTC